MSQKGREIGKTTAQSRLRWESAAVGWIQPVNVGKSLKWDVKLSKDGGGFMCERHEDAQIMSMLVCIMEKLHMKEDKDFFRRA